MAKNKIFLKIIVISLINAFLFSEVVWAYQGERGECLSPAITISKSNFSTMFDLKLLSAKDLDIETFSRIRDNLFPELVFPKDSNPHRWQHTFEVVQSLNKLMSKDAIEYFVDKLKKERDEKLPTEESEREAILNTYTNNIRKLYDFLGEDQLNDQEREELLIAAVLHDIGFKDKKVDDYSHPGEGAMQVEKILQRLSFSQTSIDNICELIKYHDLIGNIIRGKKVAIPLKLLLKDKPRLIKKLAVLNAMDMAGVVNSKYEKSYNLIPRSLENLISYTDENELNEKMFSDYFYKNRLYMLGRTKNGQELKLTQKTALENSMEQDKRDFDEFQSNWTGNIEIDDVGLFYKLAEIDESYSLLSNWFWAISDLTSDAIEKYNISPIAIFTDLTKKEDLKSEIYLAALKKILEDDSTKKKTIDSFAFPVKVEKNRLTINFLPIISIHSSI